MQLVIAEKPSVAQSIAAALGVKEKKDGYIEGGGYLISWCVGHLVQLAEAAAYGEQYRKWSYDSLPILPQNWQYTVAADKGKQFKILKELMHRADVSEVVNACDAGREGELIFRFVYEVAGCKKPMRRLWISSMEDAAIRSGFDNLKDGRDYDALFASALCRAKADWIIGINATRLFSCLYNRTLNVGRVQTPTLKMLADRDAAISTFKKEKYYHVRLTLSGTEAVSEKLSDAAAADELKAACETAQAECISVTREKKTVSPPKLFDLTSLQREAKLTAEWENTLTLIAKGNANPEDFMQGIEAMAQELVKAYPFLSEKDKELFKEEKPVIGKCPRCGSPVHESKKNYYCSDRDCTFTMWKNDRFFEERKTVFTPKIAAALLKSGKASVKGLYSPKTGKTYDGNVVLADTGGKYVNYRVELPKKK